VTPPLLRAEELPAVGAELVLDGPEGRHAGSALRVRPGERIRVGDGRGSVADCEVTASEKGCVTAVVRELARHPRPVPEVTVVQALPKAERSELAVELATEAGADRLVPWQAERCVSRWTGPKVAKGHAKWVNAARAAAKQSRRPWEPEVAEPVSGDGLAALLAEETARGARVVVLHEEGSVPFAEAVLGGGVPDRLVLVVGPEGGVSGDELAALTAAGARCAVLGPEVVRTSTAAAVALGALGVLTARWPGAATTLDATPAAARPPSTPRE